MRRGEIYWADLGPPAGRRPVLILSRNAAIPVLDALVVAPITKTIRDASEVRLGTNEGIAEECVANLDSLVTIPKSLLNREPTGEIGIRKLMELDGALRFALEISF